MKRTVFRAMLAVRCYFFHEERKREKKEGKEKEKEKGGRERKSLNWGDSSECGDIKKVTFKVCVGLSVLF